MGWITLIGAAWPLVKEMGTWLILLVVGLAVFFGVRKALSPPPEKPRVSGEVTAVTSGREMRVKIGVRRRHVKLYGLAIPDAELGRKSHEFLKKLAASKAVTIELYRGRSFSYHMEGAVHTPEGWCANEEMLKQGLAWLSTDKGIPKKWEEAQIAAQQDCRGLWSTYAGHEDYLQYVAGAYPGANSMEVFMLLESFSLAWWAVVILASTGIIICLGIDKPWMATAVVISASLALIILGDFGYYLQVVLTPMRVLQGILVYGVGALITGVVSWISFVFGRRDAFSKYKRAFFEQRGLRYLNVKTPVPAEHLADWQLALSETEWVRRNDVGEVTGYNIVPRPQEYASKLVGRMAYWPFWLLFEVHRNAGARLWRLCFSGGANWLDRLTMWIYPDPEEPPAPPAPPETELGDQEQ